MVVRSRSLVPLERRLHSYTHAGTTRCRDLHRASTPIAQIITFVRSRRRSSLPLCHLCGECFQLARRNAWFHRAMARLALLVACDEQSTLVIGAVRFDGFVRACFPGPNVTAPALSLGRVRGRPLPRGHFDCASKGCTERANFSSGSKRPAVAANHKVSREFRRESQGPDDQF